MLTCEWRTLGNPPEVPRNPLPYGVTLMLDTIGYTVRLGWIVTALTVACQGPGGAQGASGSDGARGPQGQQGPAGEDGAPGVGVPARLTLSISATQEYDSCTPGYVPIPECCPDGFVFVGGSGGYGGGVECLEEAASGKAVYSVVYLEDGVWCRSFDDPSECCMDDFEMVGWSASDGVLCLERE